MTSLRHSRRAIRQCHETHVRLLRGNKLGDVVLVLDGWLDRVWTKIQSLSILCPSYVQPLSNKRKIQGMSRRYPDLVHSPSSLCRISQNLDRGWTSKSRVCTGLVQPFGKISFFLLGQTVDQLLTRKTHCQGSHVNDLKT